MPIAIHSKRIFLMNAVDIDVSKGKSTVTIPRPGNEMLLPPCDFPHTQSCINELIQQIQNLDSEKKSAWNIAEDTTNRLPHDSLMLVSLSVQSIPSLLKSLVMIPFAHLKPIRLMQRKSPDMPLIIG